MLAEVETSRILVGAFSPRSATMRDLQTLRSLAQPWSCQSMPRSQRVLSGRGIVALLFVVSIAFGSFAGNDTARRHASAQDELVPSGDVIVLVESSSDPAAVVAAEAVDDGIDPTVVFTNVVDGYAATVTQEQAEDLANDPNVVAIFPN